MMGIIFKLRVIGNAYKQKERERSELFGRMTHLKRIDEVQNKNDFVGQHGLERITRTIVSFNKIDTQKENIIRTIKTG